MELSDAQACSLDDRVSKLEATVNRLLSRWTSIAPIPLGKFFFDTTSTTFYSIPKEVPSSAMEVLIQTMVQCGNEGPYREFTVNLWTEIESQKYTKYIEGARYAQNAISFSSEEKWFPIGTDRKLYLQCNDKQLVSCHGLKLSVVGYR